MRAHLRAPDRGAVVGRHDAAPNDRGARRLIARPISRPRQVARRELSCAASTAALPEAAALGAAGATLSLPLGNEQRG